MSPSGTTRGSTPTKVLIVDDEPNIRSTLERALSLEGIECEVAANGEEALTKLDGVDVVLTDLTMPNMSGIELLGHIKATHPDLPVALMTAHGTIETAIDAMKHGAYDYLLKPCQVREIVFKIELGLRLRRYEHELEQRNQRLEAMQRELELKNAELERLATTDPLTGLANRRRFMARLLEIISERQRYGGAVSLIMADIDHFKRVNDGHGHPVGDAVLREVGRLVFERARATDLAARIGGEEFAIALPKTNAHGAHELAEALRASIEHHPFEPVGRVTLSLGVAELGPSSEGPDELLRRTDAALYVAKAEGRNRVIVADQSG